MSLLHAKKVHRVLTATDKLIADKSSLTTKLLKNPRPTNKIPPHFSTILLTSTSIYLINTPRKPRAIHTSPSPGNTTMIFTKT